MTVMAASMTARVVTERDVTRWRGRGMTGVEFGMVRKALGLSVVDLAALLGVHPRGLLSCEADHGPVDESLSTALEALRSTADDFVQMHVEAFRALPSTQRVIVIQPGTQFWPVGWQRVIAHRVHAQVRDVSVVDEY